MEKTVCEIERGQLDMVLQDVCEFIVDCPHSTAPNEGVGYPLVRTPNIGKGRLILEGVHRVPKEVYDKRNARAIPQKDDIIFAREAPAGNAAIIQDNQEVCLGQRTVLIRPNKEKVHPQYLVYYMLAPQQQYELLGTANGATVAHVNIPVIKKMPIKLPDMDMQVKVAEILSAYDDLIENNKKQISLLEEVTHRLYKEWFVDLRFPKFETAKIVDGVPEGWRKGKLNNYCEIKSGYAFKSKDWQNDGCGVIKIKDINNGFIDYSACDCVPMDVAKKAKIYHLKKGDLLIAMTGATIGKVGISTKDDYYANQRVGKVFLGDNPLERLPFAYCVLSLQSSLEHILNNSSASSAQPNISGEKIGDIEIIYSQGIIDEFNRILLPIFVKMILLKENVEKLKNARDGLLPKLMNGEIEV